MKKSYFFRVLMFIAGYALLRYCVATPRLSGEQLSFFESEAQLKGGAHLSRIVCSQRDGSILMSDVVENDLYFGMRMLPNLPRDKVFESPNLNESDTQIVTRLGQHLASKHIVKMFQTSELTIFMDYHGSRYVRWHKGFPQPSEYAEQIKYGHLVGTRNGGWLVYRVNFRYWMTGQWGGKLPG